MTGLDEKTPATDPDGLPDVTEPQAPEGPKDDPVPEPERDPTTLDAPPEGGAA